MRFFVAFLMALSLISCGKKGKVVNPKPEALYVRHYPAPLKDEQRIVEEAKDEDSTYLPGLLELGPQ